MEPDQAIQLCRSARRDLRRLMSALERRSFYDIGHEIGQAAATGVAFRNMDEELTWLEQLLTVGNYETIRENAWTVYDLVNYYDRMIDLIKGRPIPPGRATPLLDSIQAWRQNAGRLAQMVCQIEDGEVP